MKVTEMWSSRCKERSEEAYDEQETQGCVFFYASWINVVR